jgi:hypothetical protein
MAQRIITAGIVRKPRTRNKKNKIPGRRDEHDRDETFRIVNPRSVFTLRKWVSRIGSNSRKLILFIVSFVFNLLLSLPNYIDAISSILSSFRLSLSLDIYPWDLFS